MNPAAAGTRGPPARARPALAIVTPIASRHAAPPARKTSAAGRRSRRAAPDVTPAAVISQLATPSVRRYGPAMVRPRASCKAR